MERQILENRPDDNEEIAEKDMRPYKTNINSVVDFYKQSNLLRVVNGEVSISEINNEISALIEAIKG